MNRLAKHSDSLLEIGYTGKNDLLEIFEKEDKRIMDIAGYELIQHEQYLFKKLQFLDFKDYKKTRLKYLQTHKLTLSYEYLASLNPKIGVYAGTFSPFHKGHLNIVEKAEKIFDKVIIAKGINPSKDKKEYSDKDLEELYIERDKVLYARQYDIYTGFLTEYLSTKGDQDITLIRGLRSGYDLDYEINQLRFMEDMKDDVRMTFIHCDKEYEHISSTRLRNLEQIKKGSSKPYLP